MQNFTVLAIADPCYDLLGCWTLVRLLVHAVCDQVGYMLWRLLRHSARQHATLTRCALHVHKRHTDGENHSRHAPACKLQTSMLQDCITNTIQLRKKDASVGMHLGITYWPRSGGSPEQISDNTTPYDQMSAQHKMAVKQRGWQSSLDASN